MILYFCCQPIVVKNSLRYSNYCYVLVLQKMSLILEKLHKSNLFIRRKPYTVCVKQFKPTFNHSLAKNEIYMLHSKCMLNISSMCANIHFSRKHDKQQLHICSYNSFNMESSKTASINASRIRIVFGPFWGL